MGREEHEGGVGCRAHYLFGVKGKISDSGVGQNIGFGCRAKYRTRVYGKILPVGGGEDECGGGSELMF